MIILVIAFFVILTFVSFFYIKKTALRWAVSLPSLLLLAASILLLCGQAFWHWGMKEVTSVSNQPIYTAGETSANYNLLVKHEIGSNSGNYVFVYRSSKSQKTASQHFVPNEQDMINAVKKSARYQLKDTSTAQVQTTTVRRVFSSSVMKKLFELSGNGNELISQKTLITLPKDSWLVITDSQAKALAARAPELQAKVKAQEAAVKAKLQAAAAQLEAQAKAKLQAQAAQQEAQLAAALASAPDETTRAAIKAQAQSQAEQAQAQAKAEIAQQVAAMQAQAKAEAAKQETPQAEIAVLKQFMGW